MSLKKYLGYDTASRIKTELSSDTKLKTLTVKEPLSV